MMGNAIWDDGEWVEWKQINSTLYEAELKAKYPNADATLVPFLEDLIDLAWRYNFQTGDHLQVYGDIGELFGAVHFGIKLHKQYAKGSDGRLADDFVEIKTITPFKNKDVVTINMDRRFTKLLVVRVDEDFMVSGRMLDRSQLPKKSKGNYVVRWVDLAHKFGVEEVRDQ